MRLKHPHSHPPTLTHAQHSYTAPLPSHHVTISPSHHLTISPSQVPLEIIIGPFGRSFDAQTCPCAREEAFRPVRARSGAPLRTRGILALCIGLCAPATAAPTAAAPRQRHQHGLAPSAGSLAIGPRRPRGARRPRGSCLASAAAPGRPPARAWPELHELRHHRFRGQPHPPRPPVAAALPVARSLLGPVGSFRIDLDVARVAADVPILPIAPIAPVLLERSDRSGQFGANAIHYTLKN